jgi:hypothetical protein
LVRSAGGDELGKPAEAALDRLKKLGLAKHVFPLLSNKADEADGLLLQLAAVRVLRRSDFRDSLDVLGKFLATFRYSWPPAETRSAEQQLKRETIDAIYALAGRESPVKEGLDADAIDDLVPPTLRLISILKPADGRQTPLPANDPRNKVRVRLHLDKTEWLVGESVMVRFEIKNEGEQPANIEMGGDHRTNPQRHLRFKVVAFDETGDLVDDPYPDRWCMGGIGGPGPLKPGESFWEGIPLWRHCAITRPGTYTIRVYHDLGWDGDGFGNTDATHLPLKSHFAPVVEAKITFREPDEAQARAVLTDILSSPPTDGRVWGERANSFGEVTSMRSLVYLPLIRERVHLGDESAIEALGTMPFPEATRELVELATQGSPSLRRRAVELLVQRLPNGSPYWGTRRWLARHSWRDEYREPALAIGWRLLAKNDRESISTGADIVAAIGGPSDLPRMITLVDRVLEDFRDDPVEQEKYPRPANASGKVIAAASQLLSRGAAPPRQSTSAGTGLMMLVAVARDNTFRPDNWLPQTRGLLAHPIPYVRATALENLPTPVPAEFHDLLIDGLEDPFLPVQTAACHQLGKLKLPAAAEPLARLLESARDEWLINAVYDAASNCGLPRDRLTEICVERLSDRTQSPTFFRLLIKVLDTRGGCSESQVDWSVAPKLQKEWRKLLESERARIAAGEQLPADEPPVTHALFPRGFSITRNDGSNWPNWDAIPAK